MADTIQYLDFLNSSFEQRKLSNASYSLRAFARDLGMSPSRLSEVMNRKGSLSDKKAAQVAQRLGLSSKESEIFVALVNQDNSSNKQKKNASKSYLDSLSENGMMSLSKEVFSMISDWQCFAILSVMELDDYNGESAWIAARLGITGKEVAKALDTLVSIGLVRQVGDKFGLVSHNGVSTTHDIASLGLKKFHKQNLQKAIEAIDEVPVELRDVTSMTMAIDVKKIKQAKKLIADFRRSLCAFMESGDKEEVYNLNIQLIPITKLEEKK